MSLTAKFANMGGGAGGSAAGVIRTDVLSEVSSAGRVMAASNAGLWQSIRLATGNLTANQSIEFAIPVLPKDLQLHKIVFTLDWKSIMPDVPADFDFEIQVWDGNDWGSNLSGSTTLGGSGPNYAETTASLVLYRQYSYRLLVTGHVYTPTGNITPWLLGVWYGNL